MSSASDEESMDGGSDGEESWRCHVHIRGAVGGGGDGVVGGFSITVVVVGSVTGSCQILYV